MRIDPDLVQSTLITLFETPSYACQEGRVADWVQARLESLGLTVERDRCNEQYPGESGNLLCRVPGTVEAPALFFNSHLDTVEPTDGLQLQVADGWIRTDGTTILGGDDKNGVTAILCGLDAVLASELPRPPLELLFTVQEEIGLHGAKGFDCGLLTAKVGFVFDSGIPVGEICRSAPSQTSHEITFRGKAAHAGVEPELGINAIACAADAICRTQQGRIDFETTCNIGVIQGGRATNIVCDECTLRAEVRSRDHDKLEAHVAHLHEACGGAAADRGCTLEFTRRDAYEAFKIDPEERVAQLAAAAITAAGLEPTFADGGGGSDANIFNAAGVRCVVMSCGERDVHTHREHVRVQDVVDAASVVAQLIVLGAQT